MSYNVRFLDDAKNDLVLIEEALIQYYPSTARNFFELLKEKILLIEEFPYMYPAYEYDSFFRKMVLANYLLFYSVDDKQSQVIVHRVIHSKKDINYEMINYNTGEMEVNEVEILYHALITS